MISVVLPVVVVVVVVGLLCCLAEPLTSFVHRNAGMSVHFSYQMLLSKNDETVNSGLSDLDLGHLAVSTLLSRAT